MDMQPSPPKLTFPFGTVTVCQTGQWSCSASFVGEGYARGTVDLNMVRGPDDWWVARALVQGDALRGKGIGSTLLQLALTKAVELGATKVHVAPGGYDGKPKQQRRFYEKNGFVKTKGTFIWTWDAKVVTDA